MYALVISAYESSHSIRPKKNKIDSSKIVSSQKIKQRVGSDGFTGIYRMLRPKALNIYNTGYESGYYIEHITFLPGGYLYWYLPPEGLLYFDLAVAQQGYPNDWGSYELKNGEIYILRVPDGSTYMDGISGSVHILLSKIHWSFAMPTDVSSDLHL